MRHNGYRRDRGGMKLSKHFYWNKEQIVNLKTRSILKYRTNSPKSKDGMRSGKVDFDEVHEYEDYANIDVFTTGLGKKRHPRRSYITTNGNVRGGVLDDYLAKSGEILKGAVSDGGFGYRWLARTGNETDWAASYPG